MRATDAETRRSIPRNSFASLALRKLPRFGQPTALMLHVTIPASATSSAMPTVSTGVILATGQMAPTAIAPCGAFAIILSSTGFVNPCRADLKLSIANAVASPVSLKDVLSQLISGLLPTSTPAPASTPQESTSQLVPSPTAAAILPTYSKSTAAVTERTNNKKQKRTDDQDALLGIATAPVVPQLSLSAADNRFAFSGLAALALATLSQPTPPAPVSKPVSSFASESTPRKAQTLTAPSLPNADSGAGESSGTTEAGHLSFLLKMGAPAQRTIPPVSLALAPPTPIATTLGQTQPADSLVWQNTATPGDSQQTGLLPSEVMQNDPAAGTTLTLPSILPDPMHAKILSPRVDNNETPVRLDVLPQQKATTSLPLVPRSLSPSEPPSVPAPAPSVATIKTGDNNPALNQQNDGGQTNRDQNPTHPGPNEPQPKQANATEIPLDKSAPLRPILREDPKRANVDDAPKSAAAKMSTEPLSNDSASTTNPAATPTASGPVEQRDPKTVEPPPVAKPAPALTQPPPATTASQIAIRLDATDSSSQVELRIRERAGEVQIAVRSSDQVVATTLRQDLGDLVKRLETHTSSADSIRQESPAPESTRQSIPHVPGGADASRAYSYFSDDSQQQQRQRQQQQQQRQQQATQVSPDSLDELRSVLNDLNNGVYTS